MIGGGSVGGAPASGSVWKFLKVLSKDLAREAFTGVVATAAGGAAGIPMTEVAKHSSSWSWFPFGYPFDSEVGWVSKTEDKSKAIT